MARVLLVEPFCGGSHRAWAEGLARHSGHDVALLTLPEGPWRQRMRRGAQELAERACSLPRPDVLIASDMLDLPTFLALVRHAWPNVVVLAYFHENQLTYPRIRGTKLNSWFGQINYLSALVADAVAFNSEFHRQDFLAALRTLEQQPNNWLRREGIEAIERKSFVLPVGVELGWLDHVPEGRCAGPPQLLWNHRWEFDKNPGMFVRLLERLAERGLPFRVAVAGGPGANPDPAMGRLPDLLGERLVHFGHADRETYGRLLRGSHIVVSTTRHEFFGVAMVEAMYAGCIPVAPRRFTYPSLVPESWHDRCLYGSEAEAVERLTELLQGALPPSEPFRQSAGRFRWETVIAMWDEAIDRLTRQRERIPGSLTT